MAMMCDNCGKGIMYGHKVSHAKNRSNRTWKPNLHKKTVVFNGRKINAKLCTKCIKLFAKAAAALKEQKELTSTVSAATA
jgi:large subunit ribosomal protein L28